jgi:hypothetical protein
VFKLGMPFVTSTPIARESGLPAEMLGSRIMSHDMKHRLIPNFEKRFRHRLGDQEFRSEDWRKRVIVM